MKTWISVAAASAALVFSSTARGDVGLRAGLETPLFTHTTEGGTDSSYSIADSLQPALNVLLEYYPLSMIGVGGELIEGFAATGNGFSRTGTALGPNLTLNLPILPIYARASLPLHLEPSPVIWDLRAALGATLGISSVSLYLEAAADFPLVGGTGVSSFDSQRINFGAGVWFKF